MIKLLLTHNLIEMSLERIFKSFTNNFINSNKQVKAIIVDELAGIFTYYNPTLTYISREFGECVDVTCNDYIVDYKTHDEFKIYVEVYTAHGFKFEIIGETKIHVFVTISSIVSVNDIIEILY